MIFRIPHSPLSSNLISCFLAVAKAVDPVEEDDAEIEVPDESVSVPPIDADEPVLVKTVSKALVCCMHMQAFGVSLSQSVVMSSSVILKDNIASPLS